MGIPACYFASNSRVRRIIQCGTEVIKTQHSREDVQQKHPKAFYDKHLAIVQLTAWTSCGQPSMFDYGCTNEINKANTNRLFDQSVLNLIYVSDMQSVIYLGHVSAYLAICTYRFALL